MRKLVIATALLLTATQVSAQCNELFISEYIEGSRNNKALEIYNPTDKTIDLKDYRVTRWQNGSTSWTSQFSDKLSGTIAPYSTVQLVIDRTDTTAVGVDTAASALLLTKATLLLSKDYNTSYSMSFNGDDALSLDKIDPNPIDPSNPYLPVDIFGKIGERPRLSGSSRTIGWSDSFPYATGLGKWFTIDKTLIRKYSVTKGISANPTYFNPSVEWEIYPEDMFDSFSMHQCACNTAGIKRKATYNLVVFPNPASEWVFVPLAGKAEEIYVLDYSGRTVQVSHTPSKYAGMTGVQMDITALQKGNYLVYYLNSEGNTYTSILVKD